MGTREIRDWITLASEGFSEPRKLGCLCAYRGQKLTEEDARRLYPQAVLIKGKKWPSSG